MTVCIQNPAPVICWCEMGAGVSFPSNSVELLFEGYCPVTFGKKIEHKFKKVGKIYWHGNRLCYVWAIIFTVCMTCEKTHYIGQCNIWTVVVKSWMPEEWALGREVQAVIGVPCLIFPWEEARKSYLLKYLEIVGWEAAGQMGCVGLIQCLWWSTIWDSARIWKGIMDENSSSMDKTLLGEKVLL